MLQHPAWTTIDTSTSSTSATEWLASISAGSASSTQRRGLSLEDAVTAECLHHLVASNVAPLFGSDGHGLSLLADYTQFLLAFPNESSAHLPVMSGFVVLLEHLELNHTAQVASASLALRNVILTLWKTKNHLLKVQVLLFLRICIRFSLPAQVVRPRWPRRRARVPIKPSDPKR